MIQDISQERWDEIQRELQTIGAELEAEPTQKLQGVVDAYSRMQPFVSIKSLFGYNDGRRLRYAKLILTQRELEGLSREELQEASSSVHPFTDFLQSTVDFFGHNESYSRREIALDLLSDRKGLPYFVVK